MHKFYPLSLPQREQTAASLHHNTFSKGIIITVSACLISFTPATGIIQANASSANTLYPGTTDITVYVGESASVKVTGLSKAKLKKVKWSISNNNISISKTSGSSVTVNGLSTGKATIKAKYGKTGQTFKIAVRKVPVKTVQPNTITGTAKQDTYAWSTIYQESAEAAAQYKQAFSLAKLRLDEAIKENGGTGKGLAIVSDIDGTLMDDSTYIAGALLNNEGRAQSGLSPWDNDDWDGYYAAIASEGDKATPGAVDFINYAYDQGVEVYYITNRPYYELDLTVAQLKHAGFKVDDIVKDYAALSDSSNRLQEYHYWADGEGASYNKEVLDYKKNVIDKSNFEMSEGSFSLSDDFRVQVQGSEFSSDKAERRSNVARKVAKENGRIVLYMGDSINDMVSKNEYKYNSNYTQEQSLQFDRSVGNEARKEAVMNNTWKDKWGTDFIVMPNSAYGDWQKATWYKKSITSDEQLVYMKDQLYKNAYFNYDTWYTGVSPTGNTIQ